MRRWVQEVHLLRRLHRDVLFLGFSDGVVPCGWLCGFLVLSPLFLVSVSCFFVCLDAGFHVGFYFAYVSVVPLFVRGRLPHGGRAWRPGGCRLLPNGETSTVGSLLVDCRGCGTGPGRAARCAWLCSMCVWGDRPDGDGLSGHGPHEPGPPADRPIWSLNSGPVDGDASSGPVHGPGWSAGPSLARSTVRQGGPRCRPSHGLSRGPHDRSGMWTIGPFA